MTTLAGPQVGALDPPSATANRVSEIVGTLPPVALAHLEAAASLLNRVDRKYVVPVEMFEKLATSLDDRWCVLEIDALRLFGYSSVYFDTPDLATYRAHLQGRRHRSKVRVRTYVDSGECMLEVKRKGFRGRTVKHRRNHSQFLRTELGDEGREFVACSLVGYGVPLPVHELRPVVVTGNRRATLVSVSDGARLTVDADLACGWQDRGVLLRSGYVVLESKVDGGASAVDALLHEMGVRPAQISKFCIGVASLGRPVPSNPWRRTMRSFFEPCHETLAERRVGAN